MHYLASPEGGPLFARQWKGDSSNYTAFIGHTQPTHSGHFLDLTNALNGFGWNVHSGDLRGHGRSTWKGQKLAHLDPIEGWSQLIDDMERHLENAFDGVPFERRVLLVQNISGLLTLELFKRNNQLARNVVISLPAKQKVTAFLARAFTRARLKFREPDVPDEQTLHHLYTFSSSRLENKKHLGDVMSANRDVVDAIVQDPLGFPTPTLGYWASVFKGNDEAWNWPWGQNIHADVNFLLISGSQDYLSNGGRAGPVVDWLTEAGAQNISHAQFDGGRTAVLLDEAEFGISTVVNQWVQNGESSKIDLPGNSAEPIETSNFVKSDFTVGSQDAGPISPENLIELCYEAIHDEERWVELMFRLSRDIAKKDETGLNEFEDYLLALMPHWDRSYKINQQVMSNAILGVVLQSVIEKLDIGTALMANDQSIIYHNSAFSRAIDRLVHKKHNDIVGSASDIFRGMLTKDLSLKTVDPSGEAALIHEGRPIGFFFKPDTLQWAGQHAKDPAGLLVMRHGRGPTEQAADTRISMMELAYGLTLQEASIALKITNGTSPTKIAKDMNISINTVRTHLKRVYEKMNVEGQTELVARVLSGPIGWMAE